jgi:hypothetical protein
MRYGIKILCFIVGLITLPFAARSARKWKRDHGTGNYATVHKKPFVAFAQRAAHRTFAEEMEL